MTNRRHPRSPSLERSPAADRPAPGPARRHLALRQPETLLLLELLIEDPGPDGGTLMRRLAGQLRLCADIPELAAAAGCEPAAIDPGLVRACAGVLAAAAQTAG